MHLTPGLEQSTAYVKQDQRLGSSPGSLVEPLSLSLTSPGLSFLACKMRMMILSPTSAVAVKVSTSLSTIYTQ